MADPAVRAAAAAAAVDLSDLEPPIVLDPEAVSHSTAAYAGMARMDPKAIWVFQTWQAIIVIIICLYKHTSD